MRHRGVAGPDVVDRDEGSVRAQRLETLDERLVVVDGRVLAADTPLGWKPVDDGLSLEGIDVSRKQWHDLFEIDPDAWLAELDGTEEFFGHFGDRLPAELTTQLADIRRRVKLSIEN